MPEIKEWQIQVSTTLDCKDELEAKMTCELLQEIFSCLNAVGVEVHGGMRVCVPTERAKEIMSEQGIKLDPIPEMAPEPEVKANPNKNLN